MTKYDSNEEGRLAEAKAACDRACGKAQARVAAATTVDERAQATADEAECHQPHAQQLSDAYKAFQSRTGERSPSNQASPGVAENSARLVAESDSGLG